MTKTPQEYEAIITKQDEYIDWLEEKINKIQASCESDSFGLGRTLREELAKLKS